MKGQVQEQQHDTLSHKTPASHQKSFAPAQKNDAFDLQKMMLEDKRFRKIDPAIMAQIDSGLSSRQYLKEGLSVMHDCFMVIENLKQGNYNNYVGYKGSSLNDSADARSGSSPPFSSVDRKRARNSKQ